MALSVTKQLMCPSCGVVVATAVLRRWPGSLVLTAVDGTALPPERVGLQLERARARVAANPRDPAAVDRLAFLKDNVEEMVFDIACRNGHSILRTMPEIARAIRSTPGPLVDLGR